jgi:hypothetical protein
VRSTQVLLVNGARVHLLEDVLDTTTLAYTHGLADTFGPDNPLWSRAGTSADYPRWEYCVEDTSFDPVRRAFDSGPMLAAWQAQLVQAPGRQLFCSNISFFIDLPGSPPLQPHVEGVDSWLAQVYIARRPHAYTGTTIYTDQKQVLFQLPYRDNAGWLFDTAGRVMHGREHPVPEGLDRFSIMIWYALLPV